jgi:hypothetical protein
LVEAADELEQIKNMNHIQSLLIQWPENKSNVIPETYCFQILKDNFPLAK